MSESSLDAPRTSVPRAACVLAVAVASVFATTVGNPPTVSRGGTTASPSPSATVTVARPAAATTRVHAESTVSAAMVRLVPAGFRGHGPDVARYQHPDGKPINWVAAKRSGVGYAFIKATEGTTVVNPWFRKDWVGAGRAGLPRGAYHFARPARPLSTATAQARAFLAVAGRLDRAGDMPAVLDLENPGSLSPGELVTWAQEWVRTVQKATGRAPIIYTYRSFWRRATLNSPALNHLPLWIADYSDGVAGAGRSAGPTRPLVGAWPDWAIWQWTDNGRIPGVQAPVDVNVFNGGAARMRTLADGTKRTRFRPVIPGPPVRVTADGGDRSISVRWMPGYDGNSRPTGWRVTAVGTGRSVVVSGRALSARLGGLRNGKAYQVVVEQRNAAGWSKPSRARTVGTLPARSVTGMLVTARVVPSGERIGLVAQVRADGQPLPGARVQFWAQRAGREVRLGSAVTGPDGKAHGSVVVSAISRLQARFAGKPGTKPSASGLARVVAVPRLTVDVPATGRNGRAMGVSGSAFGAPRGSEVILQQRTKRGWVAVGSVRVKTQGRFTFVLRAAMGVRQYRVVVPATAVSARTQSAPGKTIVSRR